MNDKLKIAYAGSAGAYAEIAAQRIFPNGTLIGYPSFAHAYDAVSAGECDHAVLPIENSYAGEVAQVVDLAFGGSLKITNVQELEVNHCLLALKGSTLSGIKSIVSHPQALWQSAGFISKLGAQQREMSSTATAAEYVAGQSDLSLAAIASSQAAHKYGLEILAENINESEHNTTRFAVFSGQFDGAKSTRFIMFFTVKHQAGRLGEAVSVIGKYGFNLRALKSRPTKVNNWEYYFYVEGDGDIDSEKAQEMIKEMQNCCLTIKIIGKY